MLSIWSKKLEAVGLWYDQLLAESLGKQGVGPTPITAVETRDMHSRGQQHQDGSRDKLINNLVVKAWANPPMMIGMSEFELALAISAPVRNAKHVQQLNDDLAKWRLALFKWEHRI